MTPFALTLPHEVRVELLTVVEMTYIVFVLVSFVCVAAYTARQMRQGRVFARENAPLPLIMQAPAGWVFVACVVENGSTIRAQFGFDRVPLVKALTWSLLIFGAVMLVETPLINLSDWGLDTLRISHPEQQSVETFRQYDRASAILWFLLQAVFLFPVIEELFFRGFLLTFLKNYTTTWMAIVLSGGVFAFAHLNLGAIFPLWFLGIVLGVAYQHTGSLLVPMGVHACFNLATGLSLLLDKGNAS
jgi:membrane protease YdiL (CAAX protease family)